MRMHLPVLGIGRLDRHYSTRIQKDSSIGLRCTKRKRTVVVLRDFFINGKK